MENTNRQRNIFAQYMQNTKYFDLNIKYIIIFPTVQSDVV